MKVIFIIIIVVGFFSCAPFTHSTVIPSTPLFTGSLQAQASGTAYYTYVEGQAAVSVLPFLGFMGDYYRGIQGKWQYEYGANLFFPLNKKKTIYVSLSGGKCEGVYKKKAAISGNWQGYTVDSKFTSYYLQPGIYYIHKTSTGENYKFSFWFKNEEIRYAKFDVGYHNTGIAFDKNYKVNSTKNNAYSVLQTPFITGSVTFDNNPFMIQAQLGYKYMARRFKADNITHDGGLGYEEGVKKIQGNLYPIINPFLFYLTVGVRFDYFTWKKKRNPPINTP